MFYTTLNKIREHGPCQSGWEKLLKHLRKHKADDEPLSFKVILESNGLNDAIWALRTIDAPEVRLFAVRCVRQVQHLIEDAQSLRALDTAERYAVGEATEEELDAARAAARDAVWDAGWAAGWEAARAAAWTAAWAAAWAAAQDAAREEQKRDFKNIFCTEDA